MDDFRIVDDRSEAWRLYPDSRIVQTATELGLRPQVSRKDRKRVTARCPETRHFLKLFTEVDKFSCTACKRLGGPEELRALTRDRRMDPEEESTAEDSSLAGVEGREQDPAGPQRRKVPEERLILVDEPHLASYVGMTLEESGPPLFQTGRHRIHEFQWTFFFSVSEGEEVLIRGPYPSLYDLLFAEGRSVFQLSWDGQAPGHSGTGTVYEWNEAYLVDYEDLHHFETLFPTLTDALEGADLIYVTEATTNVHSEVLSYEDLTSLLRPLGGYWDGRPIQVNGRPWVPRPKP